jgi:hypothetical protein
MLQLLPSLRPAARRAVLTTPLDLRCCYSTRLRSVEQAAREGSATGGGQSGGPVRSPDAPADPAGKGGDSDGGSPAAAKSTAERDERIAHAGGGFGPAIIQQNLAEQEGRPMKGTVDPTRTPPSVDVPCEPLPHLVTEQLPHAARTLGGRVKEAVDYLMKGEEGTGGGGGGSSGSSSNSSSATRHGAAVEVAGDAAAVARQGMPPLGEADPVHKKLAEDLRRREGV